ncbi:hypothetical protein GYA19_02710 [Candidatus Beckwithbacteria bacterium]|nr:hypothetical protein [Candidatus Beckwithbacteria bacterium]
MNKILLVLLRNFFILILLGIAVGRVFFPQSFEEKIVVPAQKLPVFGQILGTTWNESGRISPVISQTTSRLADSIESSDPQINETITELFEEGATTSAQAVLDKKIDEKVKDLQNLPEQTLEKIKQNLRKEMYQQLCREWLSE